MAREKSTRLLATIADTYSNDWLSKINKRTKLAHAVRDRIAVLESDAGETDALAATKRSLNRHSVWLNLIIESHELRFERKARPVRRLRDVMEAAT